MHCCAEAGGIVKPSPQRPSTAASSRFQLQSVDMFVAHLEIKMIWSTQTSEGPKVLKFGALFPADGTAPVIETFSVGAECVHPALVLEYVATVPEVACADTALAPAVERVASATLPMLVVENTVEIPQWQTVKKV